MILQMIDKVEFLLLSDGYDNRQKTDEDMLPADTLTESKHQPFAG